MTQTHTKGPWVLDGPTRGYQINGHIRNEDGYAIADVAIDYSSIENEQEHEANAHLIATVPELLDGCMQALDQLETMPSPRIGDQATINYLKSIIAKAKGEPK